MKRFYEDYILPWGSFLLLVVAWIAVVFMIQALLYARIIPTDVIKTLSTPDLAVAAMSGLVTAATLLGVVVTAVGALVTTRTAKEFDRLREDVNRDLTRSQSISKQLTEYETKFNDLKKEFETPEKIREDIWKQIDVDFKPADQLQAEIKEAIRAELYPKIIEEYAKALQAFHISRTASTARS